MARGVRLNPFFLQSIPGPEIHLCLTNGENVFLSGDLKPPTRIFFMLYLIIKWLHVLSDIVAFGAFVTYGVWLFKANRAPHALAFTLATIKLCEDRLANPAYGLSITSGLVMVFLGKWPLTTAWLQLSFVFFLLSMALGIFGYVPAIRKQLTLVERCGHGSIECRKNARKITVISAIASIFVIGIVFLMVIKPRLWT
jgi:uncharacterized membrane protein